MSIGKAVIKPIKDALDDLPRHTGSLRGLGVKHKQKQRENQDGVRAVDKFDDKPKKPGNPPIDRSRNPDWLNGLLDRKDVEFWRRRMAEGQQFNYQNHHRYLSERGDPG